MKSLRYGPAAAACAPENPAVYLADTAATDIHARPVVATAGPQQAHGATA